MINQMDRQDFKPIGSNGQKSDVVLGAGKIRLGEMLCAVSRTFALSIERLPSDLRDIVTTAYLLFRVSDCLEDNSVLVADHKAELLRIWARVLTDSIPVSSLTGEIIHLDEKDPEVYVAQHAGELLEGFASSRNRFRKSSRSMSTKLR